MIDFHSHTNFSYCADKDIDLSFYKKEIEKNSLLDAVCIADHGMAIYFPKEVAWTWEFIRNESVLDEHLCKGNFRLEEYINLFSEYKDSPIHCGIEVEMSENGRLIYDPFYRDRLVPLIGSVHFLFGSKRYGFSLCDILNEWTYHTERLICSGIDILAHPFRWICGQSPVDYPLIEQIVRCAHKEGVALELNGHNVTLPIYNADKSMLRIAAEIGAKISFGVDAHRKEDIGDFSYHIKLLNDCRLDIKNINILTIKELYSKRGCRVFI